MTKSRLDKAIEDMKQELEFIKGPMFNTNPHTHNPLRAYHDDIQRLEMVYTNLQHVQYTTKKAQSQHERALKALSKAIQLLSTS